MKQMLLVDPTQLKPQHYGWPEYQSRLDREITKILQMKTVEHGGRVSEEEKLRLYLQTLQKFLLARQQMHRDVQTNVSEEAEKEKQKQKEQKEAVGGVRKKIDQPAEQEWITPQIRHPDISDLGSDETLPPRGARIRTAVDDDDDDEGDEGEEVGEEDDDVGGGDEGDFSTPPLEHQQRQWERSGTPAGASATLFRRFADMPAGAQALTPAEISRRQDQLDAIGEIVAPMFHKERAREYLEAMIESGPASFNPYTKELLIDGSPIHKSNIRQVLRYFLNTKKNKPDPRKTQGVYEFQKVLPIIETIVELKRREQQGKGMIRRKRSKTCCSGKSMKKKKMRCSWKQRGLVSY